MYAYIPEEIRERERHHKLAPRARIGYLVGYQSTNIYRIWFPQLEEVRPEKNVAFNELVFFDPKELDKPAEDIIVTIDIPILPITPLGGFISEDLEDEWIGDIIEVLPPPSQSTSSETTVSKALPALLIPRATPDTQGPVGPSE